ncbi:MAG: AI-2E family transporter [Candidatus Dormiibacterota bacterium]
MAAQPPPAAPVSDPAAEEGRLRHSALIWGRAAAVLLSIFLAYQLFVVLRGLADAVLTVLVCTLLAAIVALLGAPVADLLSSRLRLPRTLAVLVTMVVGLGLLTLLGWLISTPLVQEGRTLASQVPGLVHRLDTTGTAIQRQLSAHGIRINAVSFVTSKLASLAPQLTGLAVSGLTGVVGIVVDAVISLVLAFWLMRDGRELRSSLVGLLPTRVGRELDFALQAFAVVVGGYVRAQLLLAVVVGLLAGVGTGLLGVPFPLVIALTAAIFELIPLVGPFAGGAVALLLALTKSPTLALFTLILFLAIHGIEGYVLVPRIQGRFVQLHPLLTLLALFAGVEVAGFLGALVAVPAASYLAVLLRSAVGDWRAQRPDLFAAARENRLEQARNRRLLGSFRVFRRQPRDGGAPPPGGSHPEA